MAHARLRGHAIESLEVGWQVLARRSARRPAPRRVIPIAAKRSRAPALPDDSYFAKPGIRRVQEWMGHADLRTTMRHLHDAPREEGARLVAKVVKVRRSGASAGKPVMSRHSSQVAPKPSQAAPSRPGSGRGPSTCAGASPSRMRGQSVPFRASANVCPPRPRPFQAGAARVAARPARTAGHPHPRARITLGLSPPRLQCGCSPQSAGTSSDVLAPTTECVECMSVVAGDRKCGLAAHASGLAHGLRSWRERSDPLLGVAQR